jgi:DNA-binding NtrC family response regulator
MSKILIVEDDANISRYLSAMLLSDGHLSLVADSAEKAWTSLQTESDIALLVLDHNLGPDDVTGLGFLTAVRGSVAYRELPVIVCSGDAKPETVTGFLAQRVAGFIKKPFQPQRLLADINRVLKEEEAKKASSRPPDSPPPRLIRSRD